MPLAQAKLVQGDGLTSCGVIECIALLPKLLCPLHSSFTCSWVKMGLTERATFSMDPPTAEDKTRMTPSKQSSLQVLLLYTYYQNITFYNTHHHLYQHPSFHSTEGCFIPEGEINATYVLHIKKCER